MTFEELLRNRRSARNYHGDPVSVDVIQEIINESTLAPNAGNEQPWKFIIVDEPELRNELAKVAFNEILEINGFAFKAPVLVLMVSERQKVFAKFAGIVKKKNFSLMDIGIAAEHFCLQAAEEGLGTCMLGWFNEKKVKDILSIPRAKRVELMISAGYSADDNVPGKKRKSTDEILSYNKYC